MYEFGVQSSEYETGNIVEGFKHPATSTKFPVSSIKFPVSSIQDRVSSINRQSSIVNHQSIDELQNLIVIEGFGDEAANKPF